MINMDVNSLSGLKDYNYVNSSAATNKAAAAASETEEKAASTAAESGAAAEDANANEAAVYEPSAEATKTEYKPDMSKVRAMIAESNSKVESFRRLVEGLFSKQANKDSIAVDGMDWFTGGNLKKTLEGILVDDETRAAAQKEMEADGYWGVEATATRILDFAVAISGGDPSKIEELRKNTELGFKKAEEMWGDELPEISKQTIEAVRKGFDEWEKAGSADAITLLNKDKNSNASELLSVSK
ncbi:MAG: hypothetical protein LBR83_04940 [Clostridiales bacterium]|jgi:hypothetical protein|nr:hypothetical protein [Clostridiales bacterium]